MFIDRGNGGYECESVLEWAVAVLAAIRYAMSFKALGHCTCNCMVKECAYCIGECFDG